MSAFDVTIKDTLQSNTLSHAAVSSGHVAGVGHNAKLAKYLDRCHAVNVEFTPLAWETSGGATDTVHSFLQRLTRLQADRSALDVGTLRLGLYRRLSLIIHSQNAQMILDRLPPPRVVAARGPPPSSPDVPLIPRVAQELASLLPSPVAVDDGEWLATAIV
jgi:hypothetical protein